MSSADPTPRGASRLSPRTLREALGGEMAWRRASLWRRNLEFYAGSELLATLAWSGFFRTRATGETADGSWTFHPSGFMGRFRVHDASGNEVARFELGWFGRGMLRFSSGVEFRWTPAGFWRTRWSWAQADRDWVIRFGPRAAFRGGLPMEIQPQALRVAELPVLVLGGAYLVTAMARSRGHSAGSV